MHTEWRQSCSLAVTERGPKRGEGVGAWEGSREGDSGRKVGRVFRVAAGMPRQCVLFWLKTLCCAYAIAYA